jgi:putative ABC transport system ATP-binding protein
MNNKSTATQILRLSKVSKEYILGDSHFFALKQVSLTVHEHEFVAIVGQSGSGKSTFLHVASLLDNPTSGDVYIKNAPTNNLTEVQKARLRNREIGFIFQQFNLLPKTSALENVALPLLYAKISPGERNKRSREKLEQVGLGDRLKNTPAQLSGGQQQRVAIARALINNPSIIFADEPTGNLDSASGEDIKKMLLDLNHEGATIVMVTHDETLAKIASRIVTIKDGQIESDKKR